MAEFLPLCDVLFNVISLAGYFCDIVFDMVFCYALLERGRTVYVGVVLLLVSTSLVISQIVSVRWYLHKTRATIDQPPIPESPDKKNHPHQQAEAAALPPTQQVATTSKAPPSKLGQYCVIALHCGQLGVLWRYAKLFVPVDLRHVKHEVRDLCMLRLVHAFCEAAPMLLLQLHVLVTMQPEDFLIANPEIQLKSLMGGHITKASVQPPTATQQRQLSIFRELNVVSAILSLFSVCWALASFSKNVRLQNVHRLVLTWLGVIFQFLWRLGTVIARVTSLTVYASLYGYWIFLVIVLHWFSMFLWLISPKNVFHGERISKVRKATLAALIACVYVFAYVNLQEVKHRQKMITFYVVMFLENWLLVCLWLVGVWPNRPENWYIVPMLVMGSFMFGMGFMVLYYRYFHVRRLGYEAGGRFPGDLNTKYLNDLENGTNNPLAIEQLNADGSKNPASHAIPGVFNCRFSNPVGNGATKRKKKKPTTFVPPPTLSAIPSCGSQSTRGDNSLGSSIAYSGGSPPSVAVGGLMSIPFWRRPLPRSNTGGSSENEGSAGSRVNIQQKLQEKKQKQLAELKIIEEEIKQGKLGGPVISTLDCDDDDRGSLMRQPIPRTKKHNNVEPIEWRSASPDTSASGAPKGYNDLNVLSSPNLDEVNNLNKYTSNYDPMYNNFGLNGINIPALNKENFGSLEHPARNMSPSISSQVSATESNSLTRCQVAPRAKKPHHSGLQRNPFTETYRGVGGFPSVYADGANNRAPSISPRNTTDSPGRMAANASYDHHGALYLDANHPRQISGTYSSSIENSGVENLPFPYSVIPPPRSKLDSRQTPVAPGNNPAAAISKMSFTTQQQQQQRLIALRQMQRAKTPEILLAPHYLDNSRIYYDWVTREPIYRVGQPEVGGQPDPRHQRLSSGDENLEDMDDSMMGEGQRRGHSDIDSQVSLPRSYTLPREFKYYRRNKSRKIIKNEHFITSTNSSDGDVDSGDDNESDDRPQHPLDAGASATPSPSTRIPPANQSQRRLRPPTSAVRNNFHNHPAGRQQSPASLHPANPNQQPQSLSATSSPLSHQAGPSYANNVRLVPVSPAGASATTAVHKPVNHLDLLCGLSETALKQHHITQMPGTSGGTVVSGAAAASTPSNHPNNALNRQMRMRVYGNAKCGAVNGMPRHETKL